MFTLTTTIALRALFSSHLDPAQAERLRRAFDTFLRGIYTRAVLPPRKPPADPAALISAGGRSGSACRPGRAPNGSWRIAHAPRHCAPAQAMVP